MAVDVRSAAEEDVEGGNIEVTDGLARHSSTITAMAISPSFTIGRTVKESRNVLLPFFTCTFKGTFGAKDDDTPVRAILTFDNVAFLLKRASEEYVEALEHFEALSKGGIAPSRPRLEFTRRWLEEGASAMDEASRQIAALIDDLEPETAAGAEDGADDALNDTAPAKPRSKVRIRRRPPQDAAQ